MPPALNSPFSNYPKLLQFAMRFLLLLPILLCTSSGFADTARDVRSRILNGQDTEWVPYTTSVFGFYEDYDSVGSGSFITHRHVLSVLSSTMPSRRMSSTQTYRANQPRHFPIRTTTLPLMRMTLDSSSLQTPWILVSQMTSWIHKMMANSNPPHLFL